MLIDDQARNLLCFLWPSRLFFGEGKTEGRAILYSRSEEIGLGYHSLSSGFASCALMMDVVEFDVAVVNWVVATRPDLV